MVSMVSVGQEKIDVHLRSLGQKPGVSQMTEHCLKPFGKICSVKDAMDIIFNDSSSVKQQISDSDSNRTVCSSSSNDPDCFGKENRHHVPPEIWFRGQTNKDWGLVPAVFRNVGLKRYNEQRLFYQFQNENPSYAENHVSAFDWLCLMQHYNLPTRLLDWTENILIALFFSVYDPFYGNFDRNDEHDGSIFRIRASELNSKTRANQIKKAGICGSNSVDVIIRSHMAFSRNIRDLYFQMKKSGVFLNVCDVLGFDGQSNVDGFGSRISDQFEKPVAVFPRRINLRMTPQASVFTIFGGVKNTVKDENLIDRKFNDLYCSEFNNILEKYIIPSKSKRDIRDQLRKIGVHIGTVFPELEHRARAISQDCLV
ncbi:MAG: FRG domain-containing protein [Magnetococcales bacterium]|nr:FRG domain-containing protein [Magnetococcales bacterium]